MQGHVYHWKHGWIPLDHVAALSKAKGNHKRAAEMLSAGTSHDVGIKTRRDVAKAALGLSGISDAGDRHHALRQVQEAADRHNAHDVLPTAMRPKARTETVAQKGAADDAFKADHIGDFRAHGLNSRGVERNSGGGYTEGDRVEHQGYDFTKPGMPLTWYSGTVDKIQKDGKYHQVHILRDDGSRHIELVGPRGGNKNLRKPTRPESVKTDGATSSAYMKRAQIAEAAARKHAAKGTELTRRGA